MGFTYDSEGRMTGYGPFSYTLDSMGRPTGLTETGPGTIWVQNAQYGPGGEMKAMQYRTSGGAYYTENRTFSNRTRMILRQSGGSGLTGMNLQYVYTAGANNGQIAGTYDSLNGEEMNYTYDSLRRVVTAEVATSGGTYWGQSFGGGLGCAINPAGCIWGGGSSDVCSSNPFDASCGGGTVPIYPPGGTGGIGAGGGAGNGSTGFEPSGTAGMPNDGAFLRATWFVTDCAIRIGCVRDAAPGLGPVDAGSGTVDCAKKLAELVSPTATLVRRLAENASNPDAGHNRAIRQAANAVARHLKLVGSKSCIGLAGVAAALAAAQAALEVASPYLLVGLL
jgi:hypothetical protein